MHQKWYVITYADPLIKSIVIKGTWYVLLGVTIFKRGPFGGGGCLQKGFKHPHVRMYYVCR